MLRSRDHLVIFISKNPSSSQDFTSNKEEQRQGTEAEVQISFWNEISFLKDNHTPKYLGSQSIERTMEEEE